jgi:hypothetical protein
VNPYHSVQCMCSLNGTIRYSVMPLCGIEAQSLVYAVIDELKVLDQGANFYGRFYQDTGPIAFVDLNQVQCVIGQILDQGK